VFSVVASATPLNYYRNTHLLNWWGLTVPTLVGKLKKYVAIVILAVAIIWMLTPIPEGSIILSIILAYFGYKLTLDFQTSVLIFIITFYGFQHHYGFRIFIMGFSFSLANAKQHEFSSCHWLKLTAFSRWSSNGPWLPK
jgi:hypothetical protein